MYWQPPGGVSSSVGSLIGSVSVCLLTGVSRDESRADFSALSTDTRVAGRDDDGHARGGKLLGSSAHGSGLDRGEVTLERAVREGDDARARRSRDAKEVLEGEQEDISRRESRAEIVECCSDHGQSEYTPHYT